MGLGIGKNIGMGLVMGKKLIQTLVNIGENIGMGLGIGKNIGMGLGICKKIGMGLGIGKNTLDSRQCKRKEALNYYCPTAQSKSQQSQLNSLHSWDYNWRDYDCRDFKTPH